MLRRPDMHTWPSAEISTWLDFTLLQRQHKHVDLLKSLPLRPIATLLVSLVSDVTFENLKVSPVHVAHVVDVLESSEHAQ